MRYLFVSICLILGSTTFAQRNDLITTIDFVQILNNYEEEATFYYQKNWKVLRDLAIENGYIDSYQVLETPYSESEPFHIMLITTYRDKEQYELREAHFRQLIDGRGGLNLLNDVQPGEFRKTLFSKEMVRHWD